MNPYAFPPFLAAVLNLVLMAWVTTQGAPGLVRRTFLLWNTSVFLWNASIAVGYSQLRWRS